MKLRFEVDQADSFRRGIDRPKSIVSIEINPADIPEAIRTLIADHLVGIDVLQHFFHNGEVIQGYPIKELTHTAREPKRIVAKAANLDALVEAIKLNDEFINRIHASFNQPVQFRLIEKPPKNETDYTPISYQNPRQLEEIAQWLRSKRRVYFDCSLHDVQNTLNKVIHANSYVVYLLPQPPSTAFARFYCEPVFYSEFRGRKVLAHSPVVVFNAKTGRTAEAQNLYQAIDIYLISGVQPGTLIDDLSILTWEQKKWVEVAPEGLIDMANEAQAKRNRGPEEG